MAEGEAAASVADAKPDDVADGDAVGSAAGYTSPQAKEAPAGSSLEELAAEAKAKFETLLSGVKDEEVLRALIELTDSEGLESLVKRGRPPKWKKAGGSFSAASSAPSASAASYVTANQVSQGSAATKAKNFGVVSGASIAMGGAGQGGGLGLNRPGAGPKVQNFAPRGSITNDLVVDKSINEAWDQVQDQNAPMGWVLCTYSTDGKSLQLKETGNGLKAFKDALCDELAWAGFRCWGVDKRGGVECRRPKFLNVQYKPESASAIKKAKMSSHKSAVKGVMPGTHLDLIVEHPENDLLETLLMEKLQAATGAHKPNGYEFEEGVFLEADFYGLGIGASCKGENSKNTT